jgi:hypothetical protein
MASHAETHQARSTDSAGESASQMIPCLSLGFDRAQHRRAPRLSVKRIRRKALLQEVKGLLRIKSFSAEALQRASKG